VRFSAGGWAAFHHTDTTDNQDYTVMPLHDFYLPYEVRLLEEQLYHALRTPHWTSPLIAFFTRRQIQQTHFERIAFAAKQLRHRSMTIPALANQVNLSERQFGRVFRQIIGLSPKQFSRIARLERILVAPDYNTYALTLEQMALRHGFHDASHLVHEFQELVGMSPVDYFGGYYDLIDQKFREHDRFLQWDSDSMKVSFKP
jgi:AraC-like DNA-binding protein